MRGIIDRILRCNPKTTAMGLVQITAGVAGLVKGLPDAHTDHGQLLIFPAAVALVSGIQGVLSADAGAVAKNTARMDEADRDAGRL